MCNTHPHCALWTNRRLHPHYCEMVEHCQCKEPPKRQKTERHPAGSHILHGGHKNEFSQCPFQLAVHLEAELRHICTHRGNSCGTGADKLFTHKAVPVLSGRTEVLVRSSREVPNRLLSWAFSERQLAVHSTTSNSTDLENRKEATPSEDPDADTTTWYWWKEAQWLGIMSIQ